MSLDDLEVECEGTPLVSEILSRSSHVQFAATPLPITLYLCRGTQELALVGTLTGGRSVRQLRASLGPLSMECTLNLARCARNERLVFNWEFTLTTWSNRPLSQLPHFERVRQLLIQRGPLTIRAEIDGIHVFRLSQGEGDAELALTANSALDYLHRARVIAQQCGVDPIFPGLLREYDLDTIDELSGQLFGARGAAMTLHCWIARAQVEQLLEQPEAALKSPVSLRLTEGPSEYELFGTPISLAQRDIDIINAVLATSPSALSEWLESTAESRARLEFSMTTDSIIAVTRPRDAG